MMTIRTQCVGVALLFVAAVAAVAAQEPSAASELAKVIIVSAEVPGDGKVCIDATGVRCVSVKTIRDLAAKDGEESPLERLTREYVNAQAELARQLAINAELSAELGPLRAPRHQQAIEEQRARLQAEAEARTPGYAYDPRTGVRVKRPAPKKEPTKK